MVPYPDIRLQKAFLKIKGDIAYLYTQILRDRQLVLDISTILSTLSSKLDNLEKKVDSLLENKNSIGNEGVNDALTTGQRLVDGPSTDRQKPLESQNLPDLSKNKAEFNLIKPDFKWGYNPKYVTYQRPVNDPLTDVDGFLKLSKKQLLMYITIFKLELELGRPITYEDLIKKLSRTDSAVRHYIRILKTLKIPLFIFTNADNILCISIPIEFRTIEFEKKLLDLLDSLHKRPKS
ncbi:hypothetical protein J4455_00320 [Candidatus Woesearchaeota archaeon]|nr:hypothetical protein [Candidatus Woesearchaeota archaeon]